MGFEPYEWFNICEGLKEELRKKEEEIEELQDENYGWFSLYDLQDVEIYNLKEKIEHLEKELAISNRLLDIWMPDNIFPEEFHTQEQFQDIIDLYGKIEVWGEVFPREEQQEKDEE